MRKKRSIPASKDVGPDTVVFDKADQVEKAQDLRKHLKALDEEISTLEAKAKEAKGKEAEGKEAEGEEVEQIKQTIFLRQQTRERLVERIEKLEAEVND